ncbi:hypothetical protein SAMN05421539_103375 [Jannaschia seohaensis]|uniref:Uncharacterized protein n=1 Tax=Jannaschia seohaensis TaxID=475081 RepID=A0A2Y9BZM9_9RHOB|nr:hypothetical protein BCF38_103375 [Jannaschia seohaensis]SSA44652.1 hypothetical protein SAMN05421539_103375 [Jannaschia seohaensis]
MAMNPNYRRIGVRADRIAPNGVFAGCQSLIRLRQSLPMTTEGQFEMLLP